jgi:hypothetical protein
MDDVFLSIAEQLKGSASVVNQVQSLMQCMTDEKQAWFQWLTLEARKLDDDSWTSFRSDTYQLLQKYMNAHAHQAQQQQVPQQRASHQQSAFVRPGSAPLPHTSMQMPMGPASTNQSWLPQQGGWGPQGNVASSQSWTAAVGPMSTSGQGPVSTSGQGPMSTSGQGPVSTSGQGPMSTSGQGGMSLGGQGGMSSSHTSNTSPSGSQRRVLDTTNFSGLSPYLDSMNTPDPGNIMGSEF